MVGSECKMEIVSYVIVVNSVSEVLIEWIIKIDLVIMVVGLIVLDIIVKIIVKGLSVCFVVGNM